MRPKQLNICTSAYFKTTVLQIRICLDENKQCFFFVSIREDNSKCQR